MPNTKLIMEQVTSPDNVKRIKEDTTRFLMYNGKIRDSIKDAIKKEFEKPETIAQLEKRIVPINIMQKIIVKLAGVYNQAPVRTPKDKDPGDQELITLLEEPLKIDQKMKFANRYFKLHKHVALEPYLDHMGIPRMRVLPSQTYTPISTDPVQPERMTVWVKHVHINNDTKNSRFQIWTDETFQIVDGEGIVKQDEMNALNNPEGINPFGVIPVSYISEADDGNIIPISDDDLVNMSVTIPLLLTDLSFASKYQLWSILAIIGSNSEKITFNPNSVIALPPGGDLKAIKPEVDVDKALNMVRELTGMLLTSKNLSAGDVSKLTVGEAASGISKMIDKAETTEDRKDQQAFFENGERDLWMKLAHHIMPWWVQQGLIDQEYVGTFSEQFELAIKFADPKPPLGDEGVVRLEIDKLKEGLTTRKLALQAVHSEMDDEQLDALEAEIDKEKKERIQEMQQAMMDGQGQLPPAEDDEDEDGVVEGGAKA